MKKIFLSSFALCVLGSLIADASGVDPDLGEGGGGAVEVQNGNGAAGRVVDGGNELFYENRKGGRMKISEAFQSTHVDWKPTGPVVCSWSPDGSYLAVFIPHPRVTVVSVVDLRNDAVLPEVFTEAKKLPDWYSDVYSTHDQPSKWRGSSLMIDTSVVFLDGRRTNTTRVLTTSENNFTISYDAGD